MLIHIKIAGTLLIALSALHIIFPRYFNWKEELRHLSLMNRQMMHVHSFFIAFVILLLGILSVTSANDLVHTSFGNKVVLGIGIFWLARLATQFFWYSPRLWKGKRFETAVHVAFSVLWTYLSGVYLLVGILN